MASILAKEDLGLLISVSLPLKNLLKLKLLLKTSSKKRSLAHSTDYPQRSMICLELFTSSSSQLDLFLSDLQEKIRLLSEEEMEEVQTATSSKLREKTQKSLCSDL